MKLAQIESCSVRSLRGQLENTETRERKREREGTPKTEVDVFDRAGHKAIVF